jgi:hypothetical protein
MGQRIICIYATLSKEGAKDIKLVIQSFYADSTSPCFVIEDWTYKGSIGGTIGTLEEILQLQVARHPGYTVTRRVDVLSEPPDQRDSLTKRSPDGYLAVLVSKIADSEGRFAVSATQLKQGNIIAHITVKFASGNSTRINYNTQDRTHETFVQSSPGDQVTDVEITEATPF